MVHSAMDVQHPLVGQHGAEWCASRRAVIAVRARDDMHSRRNSDQDEARLSDFERGAALALCALRFIKTYADKRYCRCAACLDLDCGKCRECLDKSRFGGAGKRKRKCLQKAESCLLVRAHRP